MRPRSAAETARTRLSARASRPAATRTRFSEVVDNVVGANLICHNNSPGARWAIAHGGPNTVDGNKIEECSGL